MAIRLKTASGTVLVGGAPPSTATSDALAAAFDRITDGESNFPRRFATSPTTPTGSGTLRGGYFTATVSEAITKAAVWTGSTPAAATPSLVRIGFWEAADDGTLGALVASTPNDTSMLAVANTEYERAFSAPWEKVAGSRYYAGLLVVTSATAPTVIGTTAAALAIIAARSPQLVGQVLNQTDLTSSPSSVLASTAAPYIEMRR